MHFWHTRSRLLAKKLPSKPDTTPTFRTYFQTRLIDVSTFFAIAGEGGDEPPHALADRLSAHTPPHEHDSGPRHLKITCTAKPLRTTEILAERVALDPHAQAARQCTSGTPAPACWRRSCRGTCALPLERARPRNVSLHENIFSYILNIYYLNILIL